MKKIKTSIIAASLILMCADASAYRILDTGAEAEMPTRNVSMTETGVTVEYSISDYVKTADDLFPESFTLTVPGFGINTIGGEAAWPVRTDFFLIPDGYI